VEDDFGGVALFLCNGDEFLRFENLIHLENC
jgi:hypothetical protein